MFKPRSKTYKLKPCIYNVLYKILISLVFVFFVLIINKFNPEFISKFKYNMFNKSFNFIKVNKVSKKVLGRDVVYNSNSPDTLNAMNEDFTSSSISKYYEGEKIKVSSSLPISTFESGVVIYNGLKDHYNNTVIIQGLSGYNIWYGNLTNINVKTYDYVEKNSLIGSTDGDYVYIVIEKDGKFISYEDYKENKY